MFKETIYLISEFFLLFILMPISLALEFPTEIKAGVVVAGFAYIIFILKRVENIKFTIKKGLDWKRFWKRTLVIFGVITLLTMTYVWVIDKSAFFYMPLNKPLQFITILFVYAFLSVVPQGLVYRTFFFSRYETLFKSKELLLFVNAIVFSLAHIFLRSTLVMVLTFLGGLLFAFSYMRYKSGAPVNIEHAIYGNWLFAVGMGQMLAFPGMDTH